MNNLNYYAEWWENARKQTGILTKPTYLKQLEKELAQLKANPNYQHLATELAQWKTKYEKVKVLEANLTIAEQNLTKLNIEAELKEKVKEKELKQLASKYSEIKNLSEKRLAEQKQDYESKLKTATNNQVSILKTNLFQATENKELNREISKLKVYVTFLNSSETDQTRELKERGKVIIKLEEQAQESQKELDFSESQLAFANSKIKQLNPLFNQVLSVIKKNVILRGKKELKEALSQISELMEWTGMASVVPTASGTPAEEIITETNTPTIKETVKVTEPIKTAELLALEKQLALEREKKEKAQAKIIADMEELLKLANDSDDDLSEEEQLKANDELPTDADKKKLKKWKNISLDFTIEFINQWENKGFSYEQTADWINTGFTVKDAEYAWWLVTGHSYDPLKYLNETSPEEQADLKKQFEKYKESRKK
jgi:hypothetical protein